MAQPSGLLGMLLRQGMTIVVLGLAVGLLAADWLNRWLATLLYSGRREGWLSLLWVAILLGAVALVANYVPAARAARANPVRTLRGA